MKITNSINSGLVKQALINGYLIIAPTDTVYGLVCEARSSAAKQLLYTVRRRSEDKSCIILVASSADIPHLTDEQRATYDKLNSERPTTIVVEADEDYLPHLIRQDSTLAFRAMPEGSDIQSLVAEIGPLLAPSANPEGLEPASNLEQAIEYFGDQIAVYVDGGTVEGVKPSRIIKFDGGQMTTIRG